MRNNSLQNRNIFSDQILDDKVALVSSRELDSNHSFSRCIDLPPVCRPGPFYTFRSETSCTCQNNLEIERSRKSGAYEKKLNTVIHSIQ
ncbi:hypothetical protein TNCV_1102931 [Trichonephila clavipes]|nr:hypothetical protein TNCV_1102931 [Trichonephila clavipes]